MPKVSVILPLYNCEPYIGEAVESILRQTLSDLELLIINEPGSPTVTIDRYAAQDDRVRIIQKTGDKGLAFSLNIGLEQARGEYIARMDADDISLPERLETQVAFMDAHPDVDICGSRIRYINGGKRAEFAYPLDNDAIRATLLFSCALAHPTVVFRAASVRARNIRYAALNRAQDYELWARIASAVQFANIEKPLLRYRLLDDSLSHNSATQNPIYEISLQALRRIGVSLTKDEEAFLRHSSNASYWKQLQWIRAIKKKVIFACDATGYCNQASIRRALSQFVSVRFPPTVERFWALMRYYRNQCVHAVKK